MRECQKEGTATRGRIWQVLIVACLFFSFSSLAVAQSATADIVGTVTDPAGAVVVNGTVTNTSVATGLVQKVSLNETGSFTFTLLPVGSYTVSIQAPGFKTYVTRVTVAAGDRARISAQVTLGQTEQTVTVEGAAAALQTDESTIGSLITSEATQDLPLNGRNVTNLVTLAAGVTAGLGNSMSSGTRPDDRRQTSSISANGQSDEINNNMIDGMDNNERTIGSIGVRPSIDAIDQVKVLTNLYTAEISRSGGAVVDLITKSGGNRFHGTLFEFVRNDKFDAKDYFAPEGPAPKLRQNQFGGSIGGPIVKQKAFFFFDYENFRQVKGITYTSTVPTLYEEQNPGDFTDLGANCAKITNIDPIGLNYLKLYPAPNKSVPIPSTGNCAVPTANYAYNAGRTMFTRTYDGRGDWHLSNSDSIFGRYTQNGLDMYNPGFFPLVQINGTTVNPGAGSGGANFAGPAMDKESSAAVGWTHVFTPNLILDLKAQYLRIDNETKTVNSGQATADLFGFPAGTVNLPGDELSSGIPNIAFNSQGYAGLGDADWVPLIDINNTFQYLGSVSWVKGRHSFKMGAGVIRRQIVPIQSGEPRGDSSVNSLDPNLPGGAVYNPDGSVKYYGNDLAVLLSGYATYITRGYTVLNPSYRSWEPSVYAQDDWRATSNLTLNLGVRYDIFTPYNDKAKAFSNFDFSKWLLVGPGLPGDQKSNGTAGVKTDYTDVAPRLGFAWTVRNGLVVRGGYGMTFHPGNEASGSYMKNAPSGFNFNCGDKNTPVSATVGCSDNADQDYGDEATGAWKLSKGLPVPSVDMSLATDPSTYPSQGFGITDFNIKASFLHQFSLNVEKDFSGNVFTAAYVGNRGGRLVQNGVNVNRRPYYDADNPNNFPYYTFIGSTSMTERASNLNSNYNALQISLQRRMKTGLAAAVNYTWSHNLTNAQVLDEGNGVGNCYGACHMDDGNGGTKIVNSNVQYDYGNADLDTRHRMSLTFNYDLPFGNTLTGPAALIVKGWSVNAIYYAQTGNPISIGSSTNNTVVYGGQRPNQSTGSSSFKKSLDEWYDVTQFTAPHGYLLGNAHRNSLFGPGTQALSFSIFKSFPVMEFAKLQFRAEAFNLFNTPTFNNPNTTIYYDASGRGEPGVNGTASITSTTAASTPRQLQLALKLIF